MALNTEGVNIIITGDASQAIKAIQDTQQATNALKDQSINVNVGANVDALGTLKSATGQFMTMGGYLASQFSSGFMKHAAEWSGNFDLIGKRLETAFGTVFNTITAGAKAVANSLNTIVRNALAVGGGFEAQMTTVKVISGATAEELDTLIKKAREMGATLPITAKDAGMAMQMLVQRGNSVADTLATVDSVANLAIAQSTSMGEVAELLGMAMSSFNLEIDEAAKITAVFNNACNQSPLSMERLMAAMKYAAPAAGSLGISLTDAVSAMEAISKVLPSGEMIGTGYAMVLSKIAAKSRIAGVETHNLDGSLRTVKEIFLDLKKAQVSYAELNSIFGVRGIKAALALMQVVESLDEYKASLEDYGTIQVAVDEKAKTFTNTMMALSSAVEAFHIEVFTQIKEQSKEAVSGVTQIVRALAEWVAQSKVAEKALNAFLDGLGFRIPTGADFKKLLEQIDVDSIAEKIKTLGSTIRSIADGIISFANKIQTPLMFLIKHLDTFATISFWGWIGGKALQIPLTLVMMAAGFTQLCTALKALTVLKFGSILGFLSSPALIGTAGVVALGAFATKKVLDYKNAKDELEKALDEEKRYIQEQAKADSTIELDIQTNIKTGFEKLPESWVKASDELRARANITVQALREGFKNNVATAIDAVIAKFPEMSDALKSTIGNLSNSTLSQLSKVLQGNEEAFNALPPHMKKVAEQLYYMDVRAGQATGSLGKLLIEMKKLEEAAAAGNKPTKTQLALFAEELSASVASLLDSVPANIEKFQDFLSNQNIELPVTVSLEQAQKQIQELSKSIGEKFNIPADIVSSAILAQLDNLAAKGDKTAQALRNGWKDASKPLEDFMQTAQDAVKYLGASPEKFTPALNSLTKGIQKIDPLTGKVTEQFKKAYDALKQWSSVTFDQLAQRIQRIRRAVEGGFIDQSALQAEFERVSKQVKLQVSAELAPTRESYKSQDAFNSVVASEYVARMGELGGEAFMNLLQREFSGLYDKSGAAIGAAIMKQVDNGLNSDVVMKIN
ncbi:MAG: phage tail tape measure protein, partial [Synergistaceae bacterium]|nr:phage tail tape measure protein [Synergistaceae bacterium]